MDSQHRHDLQDNLLARWLEQKVEFLKPKAPLILFGLVALVVAVWGFGLLRSSTRSTRDASWDSFAIAMERGRPDMLLLKKVATDLSGGPSADWAAVTHADGKLYIAAESYLINRAASNDAIGAAKESYQQLRGSSDRRVRNRAVFGLARVAELEGDLGEAAELYGQVDGAFAQAAAERAEELATDRVKQDYAWLATAQPTVRRPAGGSRPPMTIPDFSVDAIDTPGGAEASPPPEEQLTGEQALDAILESSERRAAQDEAETGDEPLTEDAEGPALEASEATDATGDSAADEAEAAADAGPSGDPAQPE